MPLSFARAQQSATAQRQPCVVVADDVDTFRNLICERFRCDGFFVLEAKNGAELFNWVTSPTSNDPLLKIDLIVSTTCLLGIGGIGMLVGIQAKRLAIPLVLLSRTGERTTRVFPKNEGVIDLSQPTFALDELRQIASELLEHDGCPPSFRSGTLERAKPAMAPRQGFDGETP